MAGRQRPGGRSGEAAAEELPVYLARPGTAAQTPRQKYGGMFAAVEGAFENKTLDFQAFSVGQKGARTPRSASRPELLYQAGGEEGEGGGGGGGSGLSSPGGETQQPSRPLCLPLPAPLAQQPRPGPPGGQVKAGGGLGGPGEGVSLWAWGFGGGAPEEGPLGGMEPPLFARGRFLHGPPSSSPP